jgi:hypothetical protein
MRMLRGVRRAALPIPDKIGCKEEIRWYNNKNVSRTNVESGISSAGIAPAGALSGTRVLSTEDGAGGFCGVMTSKDSSRSSSRSKSKVKDDMTATICDCGCGWGLQRQNRLSSSFGFGLR